MRAERLTLAIADYMNAIRRSCSTKYCFVSSPYYSPPLTNYSYVVYVTTPNTERNIDERTHTHTRALVRRYFIRLLRNSLLKCVTMNSRFKYINIPIRYHTPNIGSLVPTFCIHKIKRRYRHKIRILGTKACVEPFKFPPGVSNRPTLIYTVCT